jgi:hypothetical protein
MDTNQGRREGGEKWQERASALSIRLSAMVGPEIIGGSEEP